MPDAGIVTAQAFVETGNWTNRWWRERKNAGSLGVTGTPSQDEVSPTFQTTLASARAMSAHDLLYATGQINRGGLGPVDDPRFSAYRAAYGTQSFPKLSQLATRYAADPNYATTIASRARQVYSGELTGGGGDPVATRPTIVLTAGHRSDNDTGNPDEKNRTQYLAQSYEAAFEAAGYTVHYVQNEDGDGRPDITSGGLDTVGQKTAAIMRSIEGPIVDLDLHYEGASAKGVFAIVPDVTGLVTAISGGAPGDDTWANNPLDVELARAISQAIAKATGLGLRATTEPGVMSERATGVGGQGYRLATMAYSAPYRDRAVRLVVEHGSLPTSDRDIILTPTFTEKCAKAAVEAVNKVYKVGSSTPKPPPSKYATPGWVPPQDGKDHLDSKGNLWRAISRVVHVKAGTKFYSQASLGSKETRGPAGPAGMDVRIAWQVNSWYATPVGSRFKRNESDLMVSFKDQEV